MNSLEFKMLYVTDILALLDEHKAHEISYYPSRRQDAVIVATAFSSKHAVFLMKQCIKHAKKHHLTLKVHGVCEAQTNWACVSIDKLLIHVMTPETRTYFSLDKQYAED